MSGWNEHQQAIVDRILADARWLIAHETVEWYSEARPYKRPVDPPSTGTFSGDCSGTIKLVVCDWNGVPPFDGTASGYGNTATFAKAPRGYSVGLNTKNWQPLDLLLYKHHSGGFVGGPGEHVTMLMDKTKAGVWYCFSMGSSPGPKREKWNYRNDLAKVMRFPIPAK